MNYNMLVKMDGIELDLLKSTMTDEWLTFPVDVEIAGDDVLEPTQNNTFALAELVKWFAKKGHTHPDTSKPLSGYKPNLRIRENVKVAIECKEGLEAANAYSAAEWTNTEYPYVEKSFSQAVIASAITTAAGPADAPTDRSEYEELARRLAASVKEQPPGKAPPAALAKALERHGAFAGVARNYDYLIKFAIFGDPGVGKSCLVKEELNAPKTFTKSYSIGINFKVADRLMNGALVRMQIWDIQGYDLRRGFRGDLRGTHGIVLCFDVTVRESFENLSEWIREINSRSRAAVNIILIATKNDLVDNRVVTEAEAMAFAAEQGLTYISTSSQENTNVAQAFETLAVEVLQQLKAEFPRDQIPALEGLTKHARNEFCARY